jgi:hypothetical protein
MIPHQIHQPVKPLIEFSKVSHNRASRLITMDEIDVVERHKSQPPRHLPAQQSQSQTVQRDNESS